MGTSLTTSMLNLRYPAGAVGEPPDVPDDIRKLAADVGDRLGRNQTTDVGGFIGQRSYTGGIEYRWIGNRWKEWDSQWYLNTPAMAGLPGSAENNPGWTARQRYRWVAGVVRCAFVFRVVGGASTATVKMALPVGVEQVDSGIDLWQNNTSMVGRAIRIEASTGRYYEVVPVFHDQVSGDVQFMRPNASQYLDGYGANSLASGDIVRGVIEYDTTY